MPKSISHKGLKVRINRGFWNDKIKNWDFRISIVGAFDTEQHATDFCKKYNLKVVKK